VRTAVVRQAAKRGKPVLSATLEMDIPDHLFGRPSMPFPASAIRRNSSTRLKEAGLNVIKEKAYPDHHPYSVEDARELVNIARERGATCW
jgi:tetraacyldisaccharide 4'-kinase